ncbi:MAG: class II aldolase/adducin family protein [Actinomycetota bacterium]|nr:class II aldolase/adducin family protein [Actinomycetota bacterium]
MAVKSEREIRADIVEVCHKIYNNGWVAANDGNVSVLIDKDNAICTPTGISKGTMTPDMLLKVDIDGNKLEGEKELKPSSEIKMHLDILKNKPQVTSVVHAHPPFGTAFAVAGIPLNECILPEIVISLGQIPLTKYGTPSTFEIPESVREYLKESSVFLLENHGALSTGSDVFQAYYRMESMELFAKITVIAKIIGNVNTISEPNVKKLLKLRADWGMDTENFPGCQIGDKTINYGDNGVKANSSTKANTMNSEFIFDDEKITLTKKELVQIIQSTVTNILKQYNK